MLWLIRREAICYIFWSYVLHCTVMSGVRLASLGYFITKLFHFACPASLFCGVSGLALPCHFFQQSPRNRICLIILFKCLNDKQIPWVSHKIFTITEYVYPSRKYSLINSSLVVLWLARYGLQMALSLNGNSKIRPRRTMANNNGNVSIPTRVLPYWTCTHAQILHMQAAQFQNLKVQY